MSNINKIQVGQNIYDVEDKSTMHVYKIVHESTSEETKAIVLEALKRFDAGERIAFEVSHTLLDESYRILCTEIDAGGVFDSQRNPMQYVIGGTYGFASDFTTSRIDSSFKFGGESIIVNVTRDEQTHEITSIAALLYNFLWDGNNDSIPYSYKGSSMAQGGALLSDNTYAYTPTSDYHPATKKYVDDSIASAITDALGGSY